MFGKTTYDPPLAERPTLGTLDGMPVKRIAFERWGDCYRVVLLQPNGKPLVMNVPPARGNRHFDWIRQWIIDGGYPEPPHPDGPVRILFLSPSAWRALGLFIAGVAAVAAAFATTYGALNRCF